MSAFELAQVFSNVSNKLFAEFEKNPDLYETNDIQTITTEGWLIKHTVFLDKMKEDDALALIIQILRWRKTKDFANKTDDYFPSELYEIGCVFPYNQDKDGNLVLYFRLDRRLSLLGKLAKQFLLYQLSKIDKMANGNNRFVILVDYSNSVMSYGDQYLVFHLFKLVKHFPACRYFIHYNASPITKRLIKYTNRKNVDKFAEKKEIFDHFHDAFLPQYLGGTCAQAINNIPSESVSILDCYQKLGLSKKLAIRRKEQLEKYITAH
jgi:hypothetical protein